MKRLFLLIVLIAICSGGVYMVAYQEHRLPDPVRQYSPVLRSFIETQRAKSQQLFAQSSDTKEQILGITSQTQNIFTEDTSDTPLHQKAMEYTQYQYCKAVVSSYERQHPQDSTRSGQPDETSNSPANQDTD